MAKHFIPKPVEPPAELLDFDPRSGLSLATRRGRRSSGIGSSRGIPGWRSIPTNPSLAICSIVCAMSAG